MVQYNKSSKNKCAMCREVQLGKAKNKKQRLTRCLLLLLVVVAALLVLVGEGAHGHGVEADHGLRQR